MVTFNGTVNQDAPRVVTITITDSQGVETTVTATSADDGTFTATQTLDPGDYTAVASVDATVKYAAAATDPVAFTIPLLPTTITLTATV